MRIGVIGVGRIGTLHAEILTGMPGVGEVVVTDSDAERAAKVAVDLGLEAVPLDTVFGAVDAVVITAATSAHAELITRAVEAAVPAFCEKPISLDLPSTNEVVRVVAEHQGLVQMGFQRRFDPGYRAAAEMVSSGRLGTLYTARMAGHDPSPPPAAYIEHSGGLFKDFSVHDFDILRFVTGQEVVEVYADGSVTGFPVFAEYDDIDSAVVTLRLSSGALATHDVTRHNPRGYDVRMELHGSEDAVSVGWDDRMAIRSLEPGGPQAPGPAWQSFQERFRTAYESEFRAFVDVLRGERENPCTPEDALAALRVAVACDESRRQHRPVRVEDVA